MLWRRKLKKLNKGGQHLTENPSMQRGKTRAPASKTTLRFGYTLAAKENQVFPKPQGYTTIHARQASQPPRPGRPNLKWIWKTQKLHFETNSSWHKSTNHLENKDRKTIQNNSLGLLIKQQGWKPNLEQNRLFHHIRIIMSTNLIFSLPS